ncbi:plasmid mobilization relaxosome protein MobC [Steroidobacter sp. S1-65]|uniref:Plasmid mobilization relaxosome protein MobC n=2 Tax=Steroidobacter gossypii TaxID=2805490 RepID=A0ABS1WXT5_9GAMM|nr:plasmid mobilization relaxosome protein MobC [Steroidobacter gossypii]
MKRLIGTAAAEAYLTEAAWLRRAIEQALEASGAGRGRQATFRDGRSCREPHRKNTRVFVRLKPDDRLILRERAAARGLPAATYVSVLLRAHLRHLAPLPAAELTALKDSVAELGAIGRNLNQIARAVNGGARPAGLSRGDLHALLRVCDSLRAHVKGLLNANLRSWVIGYADDQD